MKNDKDKGQVTKFAKTDDRSRSRRALSYEATMERLRARDNKLKAVRIILRIALIVTTIYFALFCDIMAALGWITSARAGENWPIEFVEYGYIMIFAALLVTAGTVLCLCGCNRIAIGVSSIGSVIAVVIMQKVINYADDAGFYSSLREMPASAVYQQAILPTVIVTIILIALALMQFFSMDAVQKRRKRKLDENAPSPKIV